VKLEKPKESTLSGPNKESATDMLNVLAKRGMQHLFVRQIVTTVITSIGGIILARTLTPQEFGTYAIVTFIVNIFMLFGDLGLSAAFIQSASPPSHKLLQISFTIQFCLVTAVVLLSWLVAPSLFRFYPSLGSSSLWLVRTVSISLYVPVFRSISMVQLEREMNFKPIALAEGVGMSLYQATAVICALKGLGVWSFILATLLSGMVSFIIVYRYAPWPIRVCFDWPEMRRTLKAGISFQSAPVMDVISQWATPAIVGTLVGPYAVGYLGLALANSRRPLMLAESVMRVSFSHFARLQQEAKRLRETIGNYLIGFLWILVMWSGFLWTSGRPLVTIIYSTKWVPAVPALLIFATAVPLDMILWAMGMSYRAANRNWSTVKIFGLRTVMNLALAVLLVPRVGFTGIPIAYLISNLVCSVLLLYGFAPKFLSGMLRSGWWLAPCATMAYACGRFSTEVLTNAGSGPVWEFLSGAVPFVTAYLAASFVLVPDIYRKRCSEMFHSFCARWNFASVPGTLGFAERE
jgi:O-antigen/teichoic acid export membrane protein